MPNRAAAWGRVGVVMMLVSSLSPLARGEAEQETQDLPAERQPFAVIEDRERVTWSDGKVTGGGRAEPLVFSGDGREVIWNQPFTGIKVAPAEGGEARLKIKEPRFANSLAASPDGKLIAGGHNTGVVAVWDAKSGAPLKEFAVTRWSIYALAISRDGTLLAADGADGTVQLWEIESGQRLFVLGEKSEKSERMDGLAFSPDGKLLAAFSRYGRIDLWDTAAGKLAHRLPGHASEPNRIAFTPDGKAVATSGGQNAIRFWTFGEAGEPRVVLAPQPLRRRRVPIDNGPRSGEGPGAHPMESIRVLLSPDTATAASVCRNGNIAIWDVASGRVTHVLTGQRIKDTTGGGVRDVDFSPDGKRIACSLESGNVEVWELEPTGDDELGKQ